LFEISVYLKWIFQKDTKYRGNLYYVWKLRKELYWVLSLKPGTTENKAHLQHMSDTGQGANPPAGVNEPMIEAQINILRKKLSALECAKIDKDFDAKKVGLKDKEWYVVGGVHTFRDMAKTVGMEGYYKVFYSAFSDVTHGLAFDMQARFSGEQVIFEPIRNLRELDQIFRNAFTFAMEIYRSILTHYRPGEIERFNTKYINEWRNRFLSVKKIEYKDGKYTIKEDNLANESVPLTSRQRRTS
jgi:hypothetical protein